MPYFLCRLASEDGRIFSHSFFAPSPKDCQRHFESEGLCVLSVKRDWRRIQFPSLPFEKRVKDKDFIMFNQELVALIKAGYPILKGIGIIIGRVKNPKLKELLIVVEDEIRAGKSLSEAFMPYEDLFSKVYTASLMAGERSGNLAGTLLRFIDYLKVVSRTKSRIRSAMAYPTILLLFSLLLFVILINFILPRFASFYADFEAQLPTVTRILMSFSVVISRNFIVVLGLAFLFLLIFLRMRSKEKGRQSLDRMKLKIPYGRGIWLESAVSLFCRTLGLLLEGGISLLSAVGIARQAVPNTFLFQKMKDLPEHIKNGESLSESLHKSEFFTPLALDMIRIGETSANLEGMLAEVAEVYDERIRAKIDTFVNLVEPVIIIFMGLAVAAMLLSVYLPIFNIIKVTR